MLTQVTLYGPLAKEFGRDWKLAVSSPREAIRMIEANRPGFLNWIRGSLDKYDRYKVIVDYENGKKEHLDEDSFNLQRRMKRIRIVPIVTGAGGIGKIITGIFLINIGVLLSAMGMPFGPLFIGMGIGTLAGGIVELISPRPKKTDQSVRQDGTSYFFDGPVNTTQQGLPVPLIYGTCLVGSHPVSAKVSVDQLL